MCGIFGYYAQQGVAPPEQQQLRDGSTVIAHRGPDGQGTVWFDTRNGVAGNAAFAHEYWAGTRHPTLLLSHRRLAIIDLSTEALQPMASDEDMLWISFNGEIYNYLELRQELQERGARFRTTSDTEVILKAYEAWGLDAFSRLVGMWAFALLDRRSRRLVLSRDRFGIKPLYYTRTASGFAFGSEIKQLVGLPGMERRANDRVIHDFLHYEASDCGEETFFESILRLPPGHNLIVDLDDGSLTRKAYYEPLEAKVEVPATPAEAAERFRALLKESVRIHLRADVPVGTCLSGGLDSSAIAMLMREIANDAGLSIDRHAFSAEFDVPEADERYYTRLAIKASEVRSHTIQPREDDLLTDLHKLVWHQDEPFGSTSIYAQWSVFRLVQQAGVKVVLDGQGADEMLGGYSSTVPFFLLEQKARHQHLLALRESWQWARLQEKSFASQVPYPGLRRLLSTFTPSAPATLPAEQPWIAPTFAARHASGSAYVEALTPQPFGADAHFGNVLHRFFFRTNLPALLRYEDRNSMAFSVEARVPFLDHRLVEYAFALPSQFKMRGGYTKRVLRDAMEGTLPEEIRMRARKMGFATPERLWQTGPLRALVESAIADPKLEPYLDRGAATAHFERIRAGQSFSFAPWRWLNLSLWMKEFAL
jgi:asparagine synthase (glutamine-hydrolysing)